jgi:hypothetical protein
MKRLLLSISPYLLLLLPIFIALGVLLIHADTALIEQETPLNVSFIKVPNFNVIQSICNLF